MLIRNLLKLGPRASCENETIEPAAYYTSRPCLKKHYTKYSSLLRPANQGYKTGKTIDAVNRMLPVAD